MGVAIFVLVAVLVALGAWYAWYAKKKRREGLARTASSLGLTYEQQDPYGLVDLPFELLSRGDGQGTENVLDGTWQDIPLKEFDYWYYTESSNGKGGSSRSYHYFSCAATEIPVNCAHVSISRESWLTRLGDHLGLRDIQFESEQFNRDLRVMSK